MPNDPLTSSRYPASSAAPNVSQDIQNAVVDLSDNTFAGPFASTAARDAAFSAWVASGKTMRDYLHCSVTGVGDQVYLAGAWVTIAYNNYRRGATSVTTNSVGDFTITHNLGVVPTTVLVQGRTVQVYGGHLFAINAQSATSFSARAYYNNTAAVSATFDISWRVEA